MIIDRQLAQSASDLHPPANRKRDTEQLPQKEKRLRKHALCRYSSITSNASADCTQRCQDLVTRISQK